MTGIHCVLLHLEPIVLLEVTVQNLDGKESPLHGILEDLGRRRAEIISVDGDGSSFATVEARLPLAEMTDISSAIRKLTSGLGNLHMERAGYHQLTTDEQSHLLGRARAGELL